MNLSTYNAKPHSQAFVNNGVAYFVLHGNLIVKKFESDYSTVVQIDLCGHQSALTRDRVNCALKALEIDATLFYRNRKPVLSYRPPASLIGDFNNGKIALIINKKG